MDREMALGLSLLPKKSMITFRLRLSNMFVRSFASGCCPCTYPLSPSATQDIAASTARLAVMLSHNQPH